MTKELLEDYPHICAEIKELERTVTDSVQGSMPDYPYTAHRITIKGMPLNNQAQIVILRAQKAKIEEFVQRLPNSELRRIVRLRAFYGLHWSEVADEISKSYPTPPKSCNGDVMRRRYGKLLK